MSELHLYHNDMSSCSQKVRLVLDEKELKWHSHHMNLRKGETRSKDYIANFNKNGVVPTLVDGKNIIIESTIIIEYLEDAFTQKSLRPVDANSIAVMRLWNKRVDDSLHSSIAIISSCLAFRFQFLDKYTTEEINNLIAKIPSEKKQEISKDTIFNGLNSKFLPGALNEYIKLFDDLDAHLSKNDWLAGDNYSLADITYTPYLTRFEHLNLSIFYEKKKFLSNWYSKIKMKRNYTQSISNWNNNEYLDLMYKKGKEALPQIKKIVSL